MIENTPTPDVGVVIVNWNTRDLLRACLASLDRCPAAILRQIVVVDNASTDGSAALVRAEFPGVIVIESAINGGFAYANNIGLRRLGFDQAHGEQPDQHRDQLNVPRYALILNPDTVVPPDALPTLISWLDAHPTVGAAGPKLILPDGSLDLACRRSFPTPIVSFWRMIGFARLFPRSRTFARYNLTYLPIDQAAEVDSVVGACMIVRRSAIAQAGLLDETFWMYGEDLDWAYRIKAAGWSIWYVPQATIQHVKRAASRRSPRAQREFWRAMLIFYRKHYRATTPIWLHLFILGGLLIGGRRALWTSLRTDALTTHSVSPL